MESGELRRKKEGGEGEGKRVALIAIYVATVQINISSNIRFVWHTCTVWKCIMTSRIACTCSNVSQAQTRSVDDNLCLLQRVWEQVEGERCHVTIPVMSCDVM